ncbi:unnamed protein product [Dibothriocephalus latus]|uniref:Uncharacterized protein n=1 Tax=Dibothriocephalus latus TaxID=60516 RepID=A0A3P7P9Q8_DIBLA|nr:unnamed protein product [Dibothriocephalus latus]
MRLESSSSQQLTHSELLRLSDEIDHCETQLAVESVLLSKIPCPWQGVLQSWISGMKQEVDTARTTTQKALATLHTGHAQENQVRLQERLNDMRSKTVDTTDSSRLRLPMLALSPCLPHARGRLPVRAARVLEPASRELVDYQEASVQ